MHSVHGMNIVRYHLKMMRPKMMSVTPYVVLLPGNFASSAVIKQQQSWHKLASQAVLAQI